MRNTNLFQNCLTIFILLLSSATFAQLTPLTTQQWAVTHSIQDSTDNVPTAIDLNGNLYITGYAFSSSTGQDIVTAKIDPNGNLIWSQTYNGTGNSHDKAVGILADTLGNVYVAGTSIGTSLTNDYVLLKYDVNGVQQFVSYYDNGGIENAVGVGVDNQGNIYVGGTSASTTTNNDYAVVKFNTVGVQQWVSRYDHNSQNDNAVAFRTSELGTTYITGNSFDATTNQDIATVSINSSGLQNWATRYNNPFNGNETVNDLEIDLLDNVYICGNTQVSSSDRDYLTLKYNNLGEAQWTTIYDGSTEQDITTSVGFDRITNEVFVTGREWLVNNDYELTTLCYDALGIQKWVQKNYDNVETRYNTKLFPDDNGGVYVSTTTKGLGTRNITTLSYSSTGNEVWKKQYDSGNNESLTDLAADPFGNVYVVGQTYNGTNYQFLAVKYGQENFLIPPDYYGEPLGNTNHYTNKGQVADINHNPVTGISFYTFDGNSTPTYFMKDKFSLLVSKLDTVTPDTLHRIDVNVTGGAPVEPIVSNEIEGYLNFFLEHTPSGRTNINGYKRLFYPNVQPQTDLHFSSNRIGEKYNVVFKKGAQPTKFSLTFTGANGLSIGANGELLIATALGDIEFKKPNVYQTTNTGVGVIPVVWSTNYIISGNKVSFYIDNNYNFSQPLIIQMDKGANPTKAGSVGVEWSTYYGGSNAEEFRDMEIFANTTQNNKYVVGSTQSANFPTNNGPIYGNNFGGFNAIVVKFKQDEVREWATYFGGDGNDKAQTIAINSTNQKVYFAGSASSNFYTQAKVNAYNESASVGGGSSFIAELNSAGNICLWSTYFGGTIRDIDFDTPGNINRLYFCGIAYNGLPTVTPGGGYYESTLTTTGWQGSYWGYLSPTDGLEYMTYMGDGKAESIKGDNANVFIVGNTSGPGFPFTTNGFPVYNQTVNTGNNWPVPYISKFRIGTRLNAWSTAYGGVYNGTGQSTPINIANDVKVHNGRVYVTGHTGNIDAFPGVNSGGYYDDVLAHPSDDIDAFILKFGYSGNIIWASLIGNDQYDEGQSITFDANDNVYVGGYTARTTSGFPVLQRQGLHYNTDPKKDGFIMGFDANDQHIWGTSFGGDKGANTTYRRDYIYALDYNPLNDKLYAAGSAESDVDFPWEDNGVGFYDEVLNTGNISNASDGFVSRLNITPWVISVEEYSNNGGLKLYPNPNNGIFTLVIDGIGKDDTEISVLDIAGKLVLSKTVITSNTETKVVIDAMKLTKGVYVIKVKNNTFNSNIKFIKQ